jgi:hypothetical protein
MSITDELRKEARGFGRYVYTAPQADCLTSIADRIDAEHEAKVSYWQSASYKDGYDEGFASADDWLAQHEDAMVEHGWVKLPVDANGKYIHAGDVLDGYGKTIEVVELRHGRSGWLLISRDGNGYDDTFVFTHHHEPTVEDVLRDVVTLCHNTWKEESPFHFYDVDDVMKSGSIAEFASRLRLAEGDA